MRYWYHEADHSMLDKYWQQALSMPSYVVNNYTVNENRDEPTIDVDLNITLGKTISASNNRMFVCLHSPMPLTKNCSGIQAG